jgi:hypothetical protein
MTAFIAGSAPLRRIHMRLKWRIMNLSATGVARSQQSF